MILALIFICSCVSAIIAEPPTKEGDKKHHFHSETLHNLLNSYDRVVKPAKTGAVNVNVTMYIGYATWEADQATFIIYLRQMWTDPRLTIAKDFAADDILAHIWKPDTFFPNAVHVSVMDKGFVRIQNGNVMFSQRLKLRTLCYTSVPLLVANDGRVNCSISMESYGSAESDMTYDWKGIDKAVSFDQGTPITQVKEEKSVLTLSTGRYSKLVVNVEMLTDFRAEVIKFLGKQFMKKQHA